MDITKHPDGLWWPATDTVAREIIMREVSPAIVWLIRINHRWGTIIQAGCNVGTYALQLRGLFERVYTFEPDADNFACAQQNLHGFANIHLERAALREGLGNCTVIEHEPGNCGAHRVESRMDGDVPMITIDSLHLDPDVIWLDIEGCELPALRGATETIRRCKPLIIVEQKGIGKLYGYEDHELDDHLAVLGYEHIDNHYADNAFGVRT